VWDRDQRGRKEKKKKEKKKKNNKTTKGRAGVVRLGTGLGAGNLGLR
jgi:hypothetical protein